MGVIHYDSHNNKELKKVIAHAQQLTIPFAPLLNLIAYHYADNNDNVKAQELLDRALKIDSTNPHFLDTQALIYYKQKNYQKNQQFFKI